jgi:hypothetical protein
LPRATTIFPLLAVSFAALGCGKSSAGHAGGVSGSVAPGPDTTTAPATTTTARRGSALTRAELLSRATVICERNNKILASHEVKTPRDYPRVLPLASRYDDAAASELERLTPPASMAAEWRSVTAGLHDFAAGLARLGRYAGKHSIIGSSQFAAMAKLQQQLATKARHAGLSACLRL